MKFNGDFLKLNRSVLAFILAFQMVQGGSGLAVGSDDDPVKGNEVLQNKVRKYFNDHPKDTDGSVMSIVYPRNDDIIGGLGWEEYCRKSSFALCNGEIKKGYINPGDYKDHRVIKFYNIPALLDENKEGTDNGHGNPNGNLTLKLMVQLYLEGMAKSQDFLEDIKDKNFSFRERMCELTKKFYNDLETDYRLRERLKEFAKSIGADSESAKSAYCSVIICENMINELSANLEERTKFKEEVINVLKKYSGVGATVGASAFGFVSGGGLTVLGVEIGTVLFPGVGTVVGGILGFAVAGAASFFVGYKAGEKSCELWEEASQRDKKVESDIVGVIDYANNLLLQQRSFNYAKLIKQLMSFMNSKPKEVCESNVFVTAVDNRNFFDFEEIKKSKNWQLAVKLARTEDQGAWCAFKDMKGLKNAPYAGEYRTKDKRSIEFLLEVFRSAFSKSDETIDYKKLSKYADGTQLPLSLISGIRDSIREYLEDGVSENKMRERIKKRVPHATDDEISNLIQEEKSRMNSLSRERLPQYASGK